MARLCAGRLEMRRRPWVAAVVLMLGVAVAGSASAQIATDGTMGPVQVLGGLDVTIPAGLGTAMDSNLFHSFSDFNIATGGSATFDGPGAFANVISRVTGGAISNIDGLLKSNIGTSGFFFINPAGVAFGSNASVNVPGAFHVSTADQIRFPDGGVFDANKTANTILSVADPSAFGFLGNNPASITLTGATLDVSAGQALSLIGGGLTMAGGLLEAPSGVINLASVASPGEVSLAPDGPALTGFGVLGPIDMRDAAQVSTRGDPGGTIYIRGGELTIDNSATGGLETAINSGTTGATDGATVGVDIQVTGDVVLDQAEIVSSSFGAGRSGDVNVVAGRVQLVADESAGDPNSLGANIGSRVFGSGPGGNINITADSVELAANSVVSTQVTFIGSGQAGDITIDSGQVTIDGSTRFSFIDSSTFGAGSAGTIDITADNLTVQGGNGGFAGLSTQVGVESIGTENAGNINLTLGILELHDSGQINASVFRGPGAGGTINVVADTVLIEGIDATGASAGLFSNSVTFDGINFPSGDSGNISVIAGDLTLRERGQISTFANSFGNSGSIDIQATAVSVASGASIGATSFGFGLAGPVTVDATSIDLVGPSPAPLSPFDVPFTGIASLSGVIGGGGGTVTVTAAQLAIRDGAQINAQTTGLGDGGRVVVTTDDLTISGFDATNARPAGIVTDTSIFPGFSGFAVGRAGEIDIATTTLLVSDDGVVSSLSSSFGDAGSVKILADSATFSGAALVSSASTLPGSAAAAGAVTIGARSIEVLADSEISTSTLGAGPAGTVALTGERLRVANGTVASSTSGAGDGGNVVVTTSGSVGLDGAGAGLMTESTSSAPDAGAAGNVTLTAGELHITGGAVISATTRGPGAGGSVDISTVGETTLAGTNSMIVTDSTSTAPGSGAAGSIALSAAALSLTQGASISASSRGTGPGGNVGITVANAVLLDGLNTAIATESASAAPDAGTAGNIVLTADTLEMTGGAEISTQSARADGGNIEIRPASFLLVQDSLITTSVGTGEGGGGNITIGPVFFAILERGTIAANAFGGPGGNILIVANNFIATPDSVVEASSQLGINGTVRIDSPDTDVTTGVAVLTESLMNAAARLAQQCGARGGRTLASFVGVGRGGLPVQPGAAMPSHYLAAGSKLASGGTDAVPQLAALPSGTVFVPATLQIACSA